MASEKCLFWPRCKNGLKCKYFHPASPATANERAAVVPRCRAAGAGSAPAASFAERSRVCRHGIACTLPDCELDHFGSDASSDEMLEREADSGSLYSGDDARGQSAKPSPKPCRYGATCRFQHRGCKFVHPEPELAAPDAAFAAAAAAAAGSAPASLFFDLSVGVQEDPRGSGWHAVKAIPPHVTGEELAFLLAESGFTLLHWGPRSAVAWCIRVRPEPGVSIESLLSAFDSAEADGDGEGAAAGPSAPVVVRGVPLRFTCGWLTARLVAYPASGCGLELVTTPERLAASALIRLGATALFEHPVRLHALPHATTGLLFSATAQDAAALAGQSWQLAARGEVCRVAFALLPVPQAQAAEAAAAPEQTVSELANDAVAAAFAATAAAAAACGHGARRTPAGAAAAAAAAVASGPAKSGPRGAASGAAAACGGGAATSAGRHAAERDDSEPQAVAAASTARAAPAGSRRDALAPPRHRHDADDHHHDHHDHHHDGGAAAAPKTLAAGSRLLTPAAAARSGTAAAAGGGKAAAARASAVVTGNSKARPAAAPASAADAADAADAAGAADATFRALLAAATPHQRKNLIDESLYGLVAALQPTKAGRITGMLLEGLDEDELLRLLAVPAELDAQIDLALAVLAEAERQ